MPVILNVRGGKVLVHEQYRYQRVRSIQDRIYWRCAIKTCRMPLHTNVFDLNDENAEIRILQVSIPFADISLCPMYRLKSSKFYNWLFTHLPLVFVDQVKMVLTQNLPC